MESIRKLYESEQCPQKGVLSFLNSGDNRNFQSAIFITDLFKNYGVDFSENQLKILIDKTFTTGFLNKKEEMFFKDSLRNRLLRFINYLKINGFNVAGTSSSKTIDLNGTEIKIKYDLILEKDGEVWVARIKNKKPDLKLRGYKDDTAINKSIELFGLYSIGKKIFPTKKIQGAIFYLTNDKDTTNLLDLSEFEYKKGKNIISSSFEEDVEKVGVLERLDKILNNNKCGDCDKCTYDRICNFTKTKNEEQLVLQKAVPSSNIKFSESQKSFMLFDNGVCRISAIAGSGKTTVIANRICALLKNGVSPKEIIALTFTVQGVNELNQKVQYWSQINGVKSEGITIKTFNQFSFDLVKENYIKLGFSDVPVVLDKVANSKIVSNLLDKHEVIKELNYINPLMEMFNSKGAVLRCIDLLESINFGEFIDANTVKDITKLSIESSQILLDILFEYKNIIKDNNYISIDNQIVFGSRLLTPSKVQTFSYKHIIVDEAQDTNNTQLNIILKLTKSTKFKSLAICGDDSQSIYSWRGADHKLLINLQNYFPELFDIKLEENFRSTRQICNLANALNEKNTVRIDKSIIAFKDGLTPSIECASISNIALKIQECIKNGGNIGDIAFISRKKNDLLNMNKELTLLGIPSEICVSELLIDNDYFKNAVDLANYFIDTKLSLSFSNYLNMVKDIKISTERDLKQIIVDEMEILKNEINKRDEIEQLDYYFKILSDVSKESNALDWFLGMCKEKEFNNINELVDFANELVDFKSDIVIEKKPVKNMVNLITAHSSKGKEYEYVFLNFDSFKTSNIQKEHEEERRVIFVAITRAKEQLNMFYEKSSSWVDEIKGCLCNI